MDKEFKEERENHVGRMIHMLSHQLEGRCRRWRPG